MENHPVKADENEETRISVPELREKPSSDEIKSSDTVDTLQDMQGMIDDGADGSVTANTKSPYLIQKTTALGMMDLALLTANANQLRFLFIYNGESSTYYVSLTFVIISIILQICVGVALIFKRQIKDTGHNEHKATTNNLLTVGIFLITLVNVFVASFTVMETPKIVPVKNS